MFPSSAGKLEKLRLGPFIYRLQGPVIVVLKPVASCLAVELSLPELTTSVSQTD